MLNQKMIGSESTRVHSCMTVTVIFKVEILLITYIIFSLGKRMSISLLISKSLYKSIISRENVFDILVNEIQNATNSPVHSISDLKRQRSTKVKGDLWEELCVLYLLHVKSFDHVWRLKDIPASIRGSLSLGTRDIGIDIVAQKGSLFTAVQCKFKKNGGVGHNPNSKCKRNVGWKELSTFYSLCARTGPWYKHLVMTNCHYVSHMGTKSDKDWSICMKSFQNITSDQWRSMIGSTGITLSSSVNTPSPMSPEDMRQARLRFFERSLK